MSRDSRRIMLTSHTHLIITELLLPCLPISLRHNQTSWGSRRLILICTQPIITELHLDR